MTALPRLRNEASMNEIRAWADQLIVSLNTELNKKLDTVETGSIHLFACPTLPQGYLLCDGSEARVADYPGLARRLGTTWGTPSGPTVFVLPDLIGKLLIGDSSVATEDEVESGTGAPTVTLLVAIKT